MVSGRGRSVRSVNFVSEAIEPHSASSQAADPQLSVAVTPPEVAMLASHRTSLRLDHWIDGTFGVLRTPQTVLMCSPNGPRTALHRCEIGAGEDAPSIDHSFLTSRLVAPDASIEPRDRTDHGNSRGSLHGSDGRAFDHASGGPIVELPGCPNPVMIYHAEQFRDGNPDRFRASLGWAEIESAEDGSIRLTDLGIVVAPPDDDDHPDRLVDVGSGPTVLWHDHVWVFYPVRSDVDARCALGAARVSIDDAVNAVTSGRAPTFRTVGANPAANTGPVDPTGSEGAIGPAIGTVPPDLAPNARPWIAWLDVAIIEPTDQLIMVHSAPRRRPDGTVEWNLWLRISSDGRSWSSGQALLDTSTPDELLYVTIDAGTESQRTIRGSLFTIYYTRSPSADRWSDARIERIAVTFAPKTQ